MEKLAKKKSIRVTQDDIDHLPTLERMVAEALVKTGDIILLEGSHV